MTLSSGDSESHANMDAAFSFDIPPIEVTQLSRDFRHPYVTQTLSNRQRDLIPGHGNCVLARPIVDRRTASTVKMTTEHDLPNPGSFGLLRGPAPVHAPEYFGYILELWDLDIKNHTERSRWTPASHRGARDLLPRGGRQCYCCDQCRTAGDFTNLTSKPARYARMD
jgi:hypothetical protein